MFAFHFGILGAVVAFATALPATAGAAMPLVGKPAQNGVVSDARVVCDRFGCFEERRPGWGHRPPPPIYRPPPPPPNFRPPPPPPIFMPRPPVVYDPPPVYRPPGGSWSAHVRWCLDRYRSYNPRTDRYVGYDGHRHVCRSPYR